MDKYTLESILEQVCEEEFSEFSEPPEHRFNLKNRYRIHRILARYKRSNSVQIHNRKINRKVVIAIVVAILLATTTVTTAAILSLKGFIPKEHKDNIQLFAENIEGSPATIESIYHIPEIPEGYSLSENTVTPTRAVTIYCGDEPTDFICLDQYVKAEYDTHYDNNSMIPIRIREHDGVFIDHSTDEYILCCVIWDNGDYILQIEGTLTKEDILALADSVLIQK